MNEDAMDQWEESRTVVVSGVPDVLPCSRMVDKLVIHFQSSRSNGGDVNRVRYPTNVKGVAFVTFEDIRDVGKVLETEQIMQDKEFPNEYTLTVFGFSDDVFFFARGEADLSFFGDCEGQIHVLRASHRSVRISLLPSKGRVMVEGPFMAVRELRRDLIKRAQTERDRCGGSSPGDISAAVPEGASEQGAGYDREGCTWVDTNTFKYIRRFHREDFDRCLSRYFTEASSEEMGDLTQITLKGKGQSSSVRSAKLELEVLVTTKQSTLRSLKIAYGTTDEQQRNMLDALCGDLNVFPDVLLIPLDSCIEVIGPSLSSHLFCEKVEKMRAPLNGGPSLDSRTTSVVSVEEVSGASSAPYRDP